MKQQRVGVGGVLIYNNKVLVIQRSSNDTYPLEYELPSGGLEPNETLEQGVAREFKEETNLKVKVKSILRAFTYEEREKLSVEIVYLVELDDDINNLKLSEDHVDYKFVNVEKLRELKTFEDCIKSVELALKTKPNTI
jgi:mutator protein MutT